MHEHSFSNIIFAWHIFWSSLWLVEILHRLGFRCLASHLVILSFHMAFDIFFSMLCIRLGFSHSTTYRLAYSIHGQLINLMVIHLHQHFDKEECNATYDTIWDAFTSIAKDARFHVFCEQIHVLPSPSLESLHWWVNMVFTIDGVHKLANVVIINSIWEDLVLVQAIVF